MVEELKFAIKIDDDAIEQSLLKQFNNAEKMADKVVLTFKNINLDDKNIEAKIKEMQKMAGKNPIDFSISDKSVEMLSAISKQLSNIFEIAKGKSLIDSSSTVSDIDKITNAVNDLDKSINKSDTSALQQEEKQIKKNIDSIKKLLDLKYEVKNVNKSSYSGKGNYDWIGIYKNQEEAISEDLADKKEKLHSSISLILSEDKNVLNDLEKEANRLKTALQSVQDMSNRISSNSSIGYLDKNKGSENWYKGYAEAYKAIDNRLGELHNQYRLTNEELEEYVTLQIKAEKIMDKMISHNGGVQGSGAKNKFELKSWIENSFSRDLGINPDDIYNGLFGNITDALYGSGIGVSLFDADGSKRNLREISAEILEYKGTISEFNGAFGADQDTERLREINSILTYIKKNINEINISDFSPQIKKATELVEYFSKKLEEGENTDYYSKALEESQKELQELIELQERLDIAKRQDTNVSQSFNTVEQLEKQEQQVLATVQAEEKLSETEKSLSNSTSTINDSQFDELKADVVEIREELNGVKEKISVIDSDGFENIKSDVEKTTESVKELNSELTELKSKVGDKSNISSGDSSTNPADAKTEIKANSEVSNSIQKKKQELASYELQLEETRYEVEKLLKVEKESYGFSGEYTEKQVTNLRDRLTDRVFGTSGINNGYSGTKKWMIFGKLSDPDASYLKSYQMYEQELRKVGYTLSEIRETSLGLEADILPIDGKAITNAEEFRKALDSIVSTSPENIELLNKQIFELESKISSLKSEIESLEHSANSPIKDVFQNDSDSSSIAKEESSVMKQVETATEKVTESIKRENVELENQLKILSQVGEFYTDKTVKQTIKQNDGQIIARTYRQKMEKDDEGKSYPVFDKNDNIVYDEAQDVVISNFEKLEKTIVDADNALRKMEDTKQEVLKLDQTASTSFIDEQIEDQKQYITLLEETIKKISEVKIEITDEFGNTSLENVYDIDPKAIQSAREKAAREYTLSTGVKQEKSDAKQSASDEQKRLKNIEQINRALNKQQILIDSIEKSYDKTKNIDLDKSVTDKNDLAELAQKKSEIETLINKLSGQDRNSSNEAEFLQLEKLIAEYKELAKYKLKANNPSEQKLGGTNLEVAIEQQIAQYDKLIIKAEKYGDKTSEIVENLKKQRDILTAVDGNGTHTATSDDYTNARDEYKIANAQVSSIEAQTKVAEQEAKEIQKAWDNAEEAITEYLKAKTKLNTLEATDIKSGNVKDQIDAQKQKVEELEIEAENARKVLSNLLGSQDIDTTTWNNFLKLMKDFEEAGKGSSQSIAKIKDAIANVNTSELQTIDKYIESAQKKLDSTKSGRDDSEKSSSFKIYEKEVQECIDALIAERNRLENAVKSGDIEIIDEGSLSNLKQKLEDTNSEFKTMFKGSAEVSRWKEIDTITKYMEKNTRISKEAKDKLREYIETLKTNGADANVEEIHKAFLRVCDGERKAKREGQSFLDVLRDKVWYQWAAQIGSYFSLNDILNYGKQAASIVTELNTQITDLAKVSEATSKQIYADFDSYADIAKDIGGTISDTISATSDWAKNGYSIPDAKELARVSQLYKNVGDGIDIDSANESLISTLKGFQLEAEQAEHIVDVFNEVDILASYYSNVIALCA